MSNVDWVLLLHGVVFEGIRAKIRSGEELTAPQIECHRILTTGGTTEENKTAEDWFNGK